MKRVVSMVLAFAMLIGMLPMTAWATEMDAIDGICGENLTWTFDESSGLLTISGTGDMDDYSWSQMYDPTSESSEIWVTDAPWRDYYNAIKSIVIESDITSIGDGAFRGCSAVTSISLSNDVEALGEYSFMDCDGIIDIVIPKNVNTIGEAAFSDCNALESVSILGAASIGNFAFSECANLISVELPETLTSIGEYGFRGCEALRTVTIPSSVRTIGTFAFVWCESLNEICFEGSAPSMDGTILSGLTCNVSYPSDDETWSEELQKEFDDTITWNGNSSDEGTSGSSHSHSYGDWYETKAPTQEAEGEERRDCIDCDYYETRITEKLPVDEEPGNSCGENLTWELDTATGTLVISGTGTMDNSWWPYETPSESPNFAPWHDNAANIKSVVINSGVTSIGHFAFFDCVNLTNVSIPEGVTFIGCAFVGCDSLEELYIPASVTDFRYPSNEGVCTGLTKIVVDVSNSVYSSDEAGMLYNKDKTKFIGCPTGYQGAYTIADSVIEIGDWAFYACTGLTSVDVPTSVTTIGISAFNSCAKLDGIVIPDGVTTIGMFTFAYCAGLTEITIPKNVTALGNGVFTECTALAEVRFEGDAPDIDYECFNQTSTTAYYPAGNSTWTEDKLSNYCGNIQWVEYADNVNQCGDELFWEFDADTKTLTISGKGEMYDFPDAGSPWYSLNANIDHVVISEGATSIGNYAFVSCGMDDIEIPDSVTRIGQGAFALSSIESIKIPSGVTTIEEYTFTRSSLNSVVLPERLKVIEENAFAEIPLTTIALPDTLTEIGEEAFWSTMLTSVAIPENVSLIGAGAFAWCEDLTSISVAAGNANFVAKNGVLFDKNETTLIQYPAKKNQETYAVPAGTSVIGAYAFSGAKALKKVELPGDMNALEECAFIGCSGLTEMNIPESVSSIGLGLFDNCRDLKNITFTGDAPFFAEHWISEDMDLTAYYPADNETWTDEVKQNYGGKITWVVSCDHSLGDWYETKEPTEEAEGEERRDCEKCDYYETRSVEKLPAEDDAEETIGGTCGENLTWALVDGVLTISGTGGMDNYGSQNIPWYEQRETITSVHIEDGVTSIGDSAFNYCYLNGIIIPNSVISIGDYAFRECDSLNSIIIPDSVTSIGDSAFINCDNLNSITLPNRITSIGKWVFQDCNSLNNITIPDGVTSIGDYAFLSCNSLNSITIPASVTSIGEWAFRYCDNLTDIYYQGTKKAWDKIQIGTNNTALKSATLHYSDEKVDWKKGYYDVVVQDRTSGTYGKTEIYELLYIDNDSIPEIWIYYDQSGNTGRLLSYQDGTVVDFITGRSPFSYAQSNGYFHCSGGSFGTGGCWNKIYALRDGTIKEVAVGSYNSSTGNYDETVVYIWDGQTVSKEEYYSHIDQYLDPEIARRTYSEDSEIYDYNGISEYLKQNSSDDTDNIYHAVLNEYRAICSMTRDEYDSQYKESDYPYVNQLMMRYYHIYGGMQIVYAFYDIDGNGVNELLVGNGNEDEASIIGLYAFDGEKAVTLNNTAGERQSLKIYTDGTIKIQNSESASNTSTKYYRLDEEGYVLTEVSIGSLTEIQNFGWVLLDISENTDKTTVAVRYYSVWDKGNETARFGLNDQYGSKVVTDETDFSFQINPTALLGQYVLVETKPRTDGQKGPDTLISMRAVETKTGTVSAANTESITIGGEIYATPADLGSPEGYVDQVVVYHLYDGKMVGIEILEKKEGILTYWNKEANAINIKLNADDEDVILYHLSSLTDENTRSWLDSTGVRNTRVQYLVDTNNILYQVKGIGFSPRYDGWSFVNAKEGFNYSLLKTRISEDRYQDVFGASYVASANASSDEVFKSMMPEWTGNCSGMSTTAVLFYMSMLDWSSFVGNEYETINSYYTDLNRDWMTNLLNPPTYTSSEEGSLITNLIENYQVLNCSSRDYSTIESTIDEVKSSEFMIATSENMLSHNANGGYIQTLMDYINTSSVPLIIILQYNGGAHAVVTRTDKIPERAENGWYRVYIYDPNHPYFPDNIFDQYQEYLRPYYSNTKDTYIELLPEENKWRWNGSDNGSTASKYRGTNADGEVIYMSAKTSDGSDISCPEWLYAYSIQNAGIPLHFDGSEPWLSTYGNKTGFVYSPGGYVDIYLPDGTLVCSVANGFPATYVDGIEFVPFVSADSTSGVCGKLIIPYTEFLVEYEDCEDISFIGFDNVINVSSSGKATIYISINDSEMHIVSKENSDILAQINNVYSNSEYTSVVADGEVCGGDAVTLRLNNDNFESDYSGDGALKVYTDNEDVLDRKYIMTLEEADGDVVIQNIRNGLPDEEVHIQHTAGNTWFSDGKSHWHQCTGCDEKLDLTVHAGGTASCTKKAICTVCGTSYGKLADHDYETSWSQGDADGHWHECKNCSAHDTQVKHTPGAAATEDTAQFCTVCGYVITPALGHTCTAGNKWYSNGTYHWHLCTSCGAWVKTSYHSYSSDTDETCNVCSYVRTVATTDPTEETAVATTETTEATVPSEEVIVTETAPTTVPTEANENLSDDAVSEDTDSHGVSSVLITVFAIVALGSLAALVILLVYKKRCKSE